MVAARQEPCSACPYRQDCPSGLWAADEYDKLPEYDRPMHEQPFGAFRCHATPEHLCHGWVVVHGDTLALRLQNATSDDPIAVPEPTVPLFANGAEAAAHGKRELERPSRRTVAVANRLVRKYPRLQDQS